MPWKKRQVDNPADTEVDTTELPTNQIDAAEILVKGTSDTELYHLVVSSLLAQLTPTQVTNVFNNVTVVQRETIREALGIASRGIASAGAIDISQSTPAGITYISTIDEVWVVDGASPDRIFRYSTSGVSLGTYALDTNNTNPAGITYISTIDEVWVVDQQDDLFYRYSTSGVSLGTYALDTNNGDPTGITYISTINEVWVVDSTDDAVYTYSTAGVSMRNYILETGSIIPTGIGFISSIGEVWVADDTGANHQILRYFILLTLL